jgi:hypothetical protein
MKKAYSIFLLFFVILTSSVSAQSNSKLPVLDKSQMDMSYYPNNYPILKIQEKLTEPLVARVIYSRPQKAGRPIFGEMVEHNSLWRLGANEATEIEFYKDVKIAGKKVNKGRYTLYAITNPDKWTFILNSDTDSWGAFKYTASKDILRIESPVQKTSEIVENMSMYFDKTKTGIALIVSWDDVTTALPINF